VKVWDLRSPTAAVTLDVGERVYAMDVKNGQALVVATADHRIIVYDMNTGNKMADFTSTLQKQTRAVSIFHDW
jgi:WD40 repeat protein